MRVITKRHRPLAVVGGRLITCHFGKIYSLDTDSGKAECICTLPVSGFKRALSRIRIAERLLRIEAKIAIASGDENIFVSFDGAMYNVNLKTKTAVKELSYRNGMNNPMYLAEIDGIDGFDNGVVFGEYVLNPQRKNPCAIFFRNAVSAEWSKVYEFPAGTVRHIHGVIPSKKLNCVFVVTGDLDNESGIWLAKDNFKSVEPLLHGKQKYRTGYLYEAENGLIYPTDTALEQNYIYLACKNENGEWFNKVITEIDGSCVSASETAEKAIISTAVEPDERVRGWRSWINMKIGPGIKSKYAQLISVDKKTLATKNIIKFKKDILPYRLFQYGHMKIFDVPCKKCVVVYPIGVNKYDGKLIELKYSELE